MAKFLTNIHVNESTKMTLFFANNGFHSCTDVKSPQAYKKNQNAKLLTANKIVKQQEKTRLFLQNQLT